MRFEDLSPEDQRLVNTDLGSFEKEAEARLSLANEMYSVGFNKLAAETADNLDAYYAKVAEASEVDDSISLDSESEKVAQELGAFIEKGYVDGLRKLGAERHGDEMAYLMPFLEEKVAAKGAESFLARFGAKAKAFGAKAVEKGKKGVETAKKYHEGGSKAVAKAEKHSRFTESAKKHYEGAKEKVRGAGGKVKSYHTSAAEQAKGGVKKFKEVGGKREGAKEIAKGTGKLVGPYAALAGLGGAGAYAAKKD